jgi:hypothetical protein
MIRDFVVVFLVPSLIALAFLFVALVLQLRLLYHDRRISPWMLVGAALPLIIAALVLLGLHLLPEVHSRFASRIIKIIYPVFRLRPVDLRVPLHLRSYVALGWSLVIMMLIASSKSLLALVAKMQYWRQDAAASSQVRMPRFQDTCHLPELALVALALGSYKALAARPWYSGMAATGALRLGAALIGLLVGLQMGIVLTRVDRRSLRYWLWTVALNATGIGILAAVAGF